MPDDPNPFSQFDGLAATLEKIQPFIDMVAGLVNRLEAAGLPRQQAGEIAAEMFLKGLRENGKPPPPVLGVCEVSECIRPSLDNDRCEQHRRR